MVFSEALRRVEDWEDAGSSTSGCLVSHRALSGELTTVLRACLNCLCAEGFFTDWSCEQVSMFVGMPPLMRSEDEWL